MFLLGKLGGGKQHRNAQINTLIGNGTVVNGDVSFTDGLHVDGVVKGNVMAEGESGTLTLSEGGRIEGEVRVHNIVLNGEVRGDVYALAHIELAPAARVTGNVYYNLIEMAMGAEVNGKLVHQAESQEEAPEPVGEPESLDEEAAPSKS